MSISVFIRVSCFACIWVSGVFFADLNAQSTSQISLPGQPFGVVDSPDGQWVFVSLAGGRPGETSGIAVLNNHEQPLKVHHVVKMSDAPSGLALTHDGNLLVATAGDTVVFFDAHRLVANAADPVVQRLSMGANAGSVYANITADDKTLFVSDEMNGTVAVINMAGLRPKEAGAAAKTARSGGQNNVPAVVVGKIPVGISPMALSFSPDEHWLYVICEVAPPDWHWPLKFKSETIPSIRVPEGAIVVVDVAQARKDPRHAAVATVPAGGSPVRLAISPDGGRIFVAARNSNAVLAFDAAKLATDAAHAQVGFIPVGAAPVPVVFVGSGDDQKVIVGNSNRFAKNADQPSTLTVIDAARFDQGSSAILGTIPAGAFPRELRLSHDGHTLFLTNALSDSLQIMDVQQLLVDGTPTPKR